MNGYLVNFAVYTLAMVGFLALAIYVYKKTAYSTANTQNKEFLKVENTLRLSATKTVYVIKAGNEKFLIAGDTANTTMLAKLENDVKLEEKDTEVFVEGLVIGFGGNGTWSEIILKDTNAMAFIGLKSTADYKKGDILF